MTVSCRTLGPDLARAAWLVLVRANRTVLASPVLTWTARPEVGRSVAIPRPDLTDARRSHPRRNQPSLARARCLQFRSVLVTGRRLIAGLSLRAVPAIRAPHRRRQRPRLVPDLPRLTVLRPAVGQPRLLWLGMRTLYIRCRDLPRLASPRPAAAVRDDRRDRPPDAERAQPLIGVRLASAPWRRQLILVGRTIVTKLVRPRLTPAPSCGHI